MTLVVKNKANSKVRMRDNGHTKLYDLLGQDETGLSSIDLVSIELKPKQHSLKHFHPDMHELFYVLKGQVRIVVGDEEALLMPGDAVLVKPDDPRSLFNDMDDVAEVIIVCSPAYHANCSVFLED